MTAKKILIIDDEPEFAEVTRMRLAASGYDVSTAAGGRDGLRQAKANQPDLILLDLMMPDMDGGDVGQALQADPKLRTIPIVYITALIGRKEAVRQNETASHEMFLSKTASSAEMLGAIARALAMKETAP